MSVQPREPQAGEPLGAPPILVLAAVSPAAGRSVPSLGTPRYLRLRGGRPGRGRETQQGCSAGDFYAHV